MSFSIEKKRIFSGERQIKNKRKFNLFSRSKSNNNNNISYIFNTHDMNKSSPLFFVEKKNDSFTSDVNINCNYVNFANACVSQIKFDFNMKKNNSMNYLEASKFNHRINLKHDKSVGIGDRFNSKFETCFSAKHSSFSSINILDSTQISKNDYSKNRNKYVLNCVRNIWTRNRPIVLYKRRKKFDKNV